MHMDSALSWCAAMLGDLQYLSNEMVSNPGYPFRSVCSWAVMFAWERY